MGKQLIKTILQVSTSDIGGGAEKIAIELHRQYLRQNYHAWLAIGRNPKWSAAQNVITIQNDVKRSLWARLFLAIGKPLLPLEKKIRGPGRLRVYLNRIGQPARWLASEKGYEDFDFPATWQLLDSLPSTPDVIHCHNLHGDYFDLRALPFLSGKVPFFLTLHDAWLLSGHCAHSFECERWLTGCGNCPDLKIYPAIKRDATAFNWQRKKEIFQKSRLYVASPSNWLMEKATRSMLAEGIVEAKIIPNGIDLSLFKPGDKNLVKSNLNINPGVKLLLFASNKTRSNPFRDFDTIYNSIPLIQQAIPQERLIVIAIGEAAPTEKIGLTEIRFLPFEADPVKMVNYYQAADIYLHASKADNFPTTILEAQACGTPVVATAVGGIPEEIKSLAYGIGLETPHNQADQFGIDEATGILVPPKSPLAMAKAVLHLLQNSEILAQLGSNAVKHAKTNYDLKHQAETYLNWYSEILASWKLKN